MKRISILLILPLALPLHGGQGLKNDKTPKSGLVKSVVELLNSKNKQDSTKKKENEAKKKEKRENKKIKARE